MVPPNHWWNEVRTILDKHPLHALTYKDALNILRIIDETHAFDEFRLEMAGLKLSLTRRRPNEATPSHLRAAQVSQPARAEAVVIAIPSVAGENCGKGGQD